MAMLLKEKLKKMTRTRSWSTTSRILPHTLEKKRTIYDNLLGIFSGDQSYEEFWALKNVSFNVKHGETFGVIGPNGSGKSTLLKVLAGVLYPDSGNDNGEWEDRAVLGAGRRIAARIDGKREYIPLRCHPGATEERCK